MAECGMANWSFWEWVAYGVLLVSALVVAIDQSIKLAPDLKQKCSRLIDSPYWAFSPLALVLLATTILVCHEFGWIGKSHEETSSTQKTEEVLSPHLNAEIVRAAFGGRENDGHNLITTPVILWVSITNTGNMPSIASDWSLEAKVGDKIFMGKAYKLPDTMDFTTNQGSWHFDGATALYEKTLTPIPVGGVTKGILLFAFPSLDEDDFKHSLSSLTLTFEDVKSQNVQTTWTPSHQAVLPDQYIPGFPVTAEPINPPSENSPALSPQ